MAKKIKIIELLLHNEPTLKAMLWKANKHLLEAQKDLCADDYTPLFDEKIHFRKILVFGPYTTFSRTYGATMQYFVCKCSSSEDEARLQTAFRRNRSKIKADSTRIF